MSAHNRPASGVLLSAPTRPRGGPAFTGRDSRDHPNSGSPYRGGRLPRQQHDSRSTPADQAPPGPRSFHRALPPFRSNNSSSTTYPRTQRFNTTNNTTNHLAVMPVIIPGGEALPSVIDPAAKKRLTELEEGRKKLLELIEEKQEEKRRGLRKWESKKREGRRDGLRSELAEGALEAMSGEGAGAGTAF